MAAATRKKSIASSAQLPQIDQPVAALTILNKQGATSIYQQCVSLKARLLKIHDFSPYLALVESPDKDVVHTLWDCLALGTPLCFLYNLLDLPFSDRLKLNTDPDEINLDPDNVKQKKVAVANFIMGIGRLKKDGQWDERVELFTVTELLSNTNRDTNGFVKVVATVTHLLDRLPPHVWIPDEVDSAYGSNTNEVTPWESQGGPDMAAPSAQPMEGNNPIREMIETERKYVQDLEVMQNYARSLMQMDIVDQDTIHHLFPGLNKLLDFQRKFLIEMEQVYEMPRDQQRWGRCFIANEQNFAVYEPYCANFTNASELVLVEEPHLMAAAHIINPKTELPAFLIKPVQRICKYPLLLKEFVKLWPKDNEWYQELVEGEAVSKRVTDRVNESERRTVNAETVKLLEQRVEDWKGHALGNFGELLLDDVFMVTKSEVDREYHVFLFEKIILCCKDATAAPSKKVAKSNSILKKTPSAQANSASLLAGGAAAKKRTTPLLLKGRIFLNNVTQAVPSTKGDQCALQVWWRGDDDLEYFTLRCATDSLMQKWEATIMKLIRDLQLKRGERAAREGNGNAFHAHNKGESISSSSTSTTLPPYPGTPGGPRSRYGSDEKVPPLPSYPSYASNTNSYYGRGKDGFETEEDGYESSHGAGHQPNGRRLPNGHYPESGRGTPVGAANGRRGNTVISMPPERDIAPGYDRERARTGDSATLSQWKTQHQYNGSMAANGPPLPGAALSSRPLASRNPSVQSGMSQTSGMSESSFGNGIAPRPHPTLRSQFSSTRLRSGYEEGDRSSGYSRYGDGASPVQPPPPQQQQQRPPPTNPNLGQPLSRSRSISNPAAYPQVHQVPKQPVPPMPIAPQWTGPSQPSAGMDRSRIAAGASRERMGGARSQQGMLPPPQHRRQISGGSHSDYSDESPDGTTPITINGDRRSPAGQPALRSSRSQVFSGGGGSPDYSSSGSQREPQGPPVKIKVFWGEDLFMLIVPRSITFTGLLDRVQRKIRLCGGNADAPMKLKYDDEDGDRVSLSTDEELQMAFDMALSRSAGQGQLTLRVQ